MSGDAAPEGDTEALRCYRQLAELSERLLAHARSREWGALPALEAQCCEIRERLLELGPQQETDAARLLEKHRLLSRIQVRHDEVRQVVAPEMTRLRRAVRQLRHQDDPPAGRKA